MAAALIINLNEIFQKIGGVDTGVEKGQIFNNINVNMFVFYLWGWKASAVI